MELSDMKDIILKEDFIKVLEIYFWYSLIIISITLKLSKMELWTKYNLRLKNRKIYWEGGRKLELILFCITPKAKSFCLNFHISGVTP